MPYLEVVENSIKNNEIPIVVFYHGWTSCKESVLVHGYELAKLGIRAILPDALYHGERGKEMNMIEGAVNFWPIVQNSIKELPLIIEQFQKKGTELKIGAAGLSMGGITTSGILAKYPWVDAGSILMGSVDPSGFTKWLLQSKAVEEITQNIQILNEEQLKGLYEQIDTISLKKQPEKINNRPLHFWHATGDEVVPFSPTYEFFEDIQGETYSKQTDFDITEGGSHHVPYAAIVNQALFFQKNLFN